VRIIIVVEVTITQEMEYARDNPTTKKERANERKKS